MGKKKNKKMVIVNLGRKKKPHTQGKNHQTPAQRCTHLFVWVSLPAGTALTQLSSKSRHRTARKGPDGSTEERGRNGLAVGWWGGRREASEGQSREESSMMDWRGLSTGCGECLTAFYSRGRVVIS